MADGKSYSGTQIFLHWLIVVLVFFQYLAHNLVTAVWNARMTGLVPDEPIIVFHVFFGVVIFFLAVWRILRFVREGAPKTEKETNGLTVAVSRATHVLLYLLLLAVPAAGAIAWFFSVPSAIFWHKILEIVLLAVIFIHIASTLIQQFWIRNNVIMRMIGRV